jgi:glycosyltransferase involved in cell wall biosynthesis
VRNGVDLQRFRPVSLEEARRKLQTGGSPLLLSVGHLVENKGHAVVIDALAEIRKHYPDARLAIVGQVRTASVFASMRCCAGARIA